MYIRGAVSSESGLLLSLAKSETSWATQRTDGVVCIDVHRTDAVRV